MNRVVFHVKRQYYEAFKRGEKTSEWRNSNTYWLSRLFPKLLRTGKAGWITQRAKAWFVAGQRHEPLFSRHQLLALEGCFWGNGQIEIKIANVKEVTA